ncbi:MAG: S8 family serine peptidase [Gammaproteobacteria bacterium]|nr:S8 family serine peptidase [Gammaproteobacteria bacterium]
MPAPSPLLLWLLLCLLPLQAFAGPPVDLETALKSIPAYAPDRVLVRFKPGTAAASVADLHRQAGGQMLETIPHIDVQVIRIPPGRLQQSLRRYRANPNVEFAEPDYHRILVLPTEGTDPPPPDGTGADFFPEQWGLNNTGQLLIDPTFGLPLLTGTADADIDAPEGWDISTGDAGVKIAILDSGVDCNAVDLAGKCVEQMSFVSAYSATLDDITAHGTHVAGIAAANTDNAKGTAGVGWQASIGNLKACYEFQIDLFPPFGIYITVGVCPVSASAAAITYAADNGYHVINMSYGSDVIDPLGEPVGPSVPPNAETAAIAYAWSQGVVIVAAAGNDANTTQLYPAAYNEVIAVAATDRYDNLASFSSFGNSWVSMMAPGENIISTEPDLSCVLLIPGYVPGVDDCLTWKSGTSMASPHVAGAAALLWAQLYPGQAPSGCVASNGMPCNSVVRSFLENGADASGALGQNFLAWSQNGRLNLFNMLSDGDGDTVTSPADNCPDIANPDQTNTDGDIEGNACDKDDDNDGLTDAQEQALGTNPLLSDTDGDGLGDFDEVNADGNPSTYQFGVDTDPNNPDTDGDGDTDGFEVTIGTDPLDDQSTFLDVAGDINGDGQVNTGDLVLGVRILTGLHSATVPERTRFDIAPLSGGLPLPDNTINIGDYLILQRLVSGSISF